MDDHTTQTLLVFVGLALVLSNLLRIWVERLRVPAQVGYLLLGLLTRVADERWSFLGATGEQVLELLAELGLVCLLFHVGLRSNPRALARMLPAAARVWVFAVGVSAAAGYVAARLLGFALVPCLYAAVALSATSVAVSLIGWERADALSTDVGEFLVDLAELDDLSAVLLLVTLVAATPALLAGDPLALALPAALGAVATVLGKFVLFSGALLLFSQRAEVRLTRALSELHGPADSTFIVILGVSLVVGGLAGVLGFSVAVGALFAGLAFSRDPDAVRLDGRFSVVYDLFVPFFFIEIGHAIAPAALTGAGAAGGVLLVAGVVGKLAGAGLPAAGTFGWRTGALIGVSMVPRAEIALVVMRSGAKLGAVPEVLYAATVVVSAVTTVAVPLLLGPLLAGTRLPES